MSFLKDLGEKIDNTKIIEYKNSERKVKCVSCINNIGRKEANALAYLKKNKVYTVLKALGKPLFTTEEFILLEVENEAKNTWFDSSFFEELKQTVK